MFVLPTIEIKQNMCLLTILFVERIRYMNWNITWFTGRSGVLGRRHALAGHHELRHRWELRALLRRLRISQLWLFYSLRVQHGKDHHVLRKFSLSYRLVLHLKFWFVNKWLIKSRCLEIWWTERRRRGTRLSS